MKTTVYITRKLVITFLLLVISVYCTLYGIITLYREFQCVSLEDLTMKNYRKGAYVAGTIDSCLVVYVENINGQRPMGTSCGFITITGAATYECYTIPMADSHYIRIMLPEGDAVDALENLIAGKGDGVYVEGQIVKEMTERNIPWYEHCEQIKNPQEEVLDDYVIRQISFSKRHNVLYFGIGLLAVMIIYIWKGKIISDTYDVEEEPEKRMVKNSDFQPWNGRVDRDDRHFEQNTP